MATEMQSNPLQSPGPGGTRGTAGDAKQAAKEQAGAMWNDAKETARAKVGEQQKSAASGIGEFAGALRNAAQQIDGSESPNTARLAQQAADGLDRISAKLRSKDLDTMLREAESFARSQPALFLGAAVAAGFLAMRFLKSSESNEAGDGQPKSNFNI